MKVKTSCDMGSIKIYNESMSCFFSNGFGDGENVVYISTQGKGRDTGEFKFLEHFTVKTKAYLSGYDCDDSPVYKFAQGRYFVYLITPCVFYIQQVDNDIHA